MNSNTSKLCPRLLDYVVIVGSRHPNRNNTVAQTPELLKRYPLEDHKDFPLPPDVVFFCQPEGCISVGPKRMSLRESTSFVFTLTEKDSGISRYGICVNFYRPFDRKVSSRSDRLASNASSSSGEQFFHHHHHHQGAALSIPRDGSAESSPRSPRSRRKQKMASRVRNHTLTSLCLISHHPFFSTFRECVFVLRKLIDACNERSCSRRVGGAKLSFRDSVWGLMSGAAAESSSSLVMHEVREIETWILRLLSAPVSVPGKTRVEISVLPRELHPPLVFALPDHTRFSLVDFPLHLPLELLGVDMCLKVLTCIMLEHKLILQSRDYNALTMSVMAFVSMLYPLEYMFPVIPLLPTCMASAEQLLLAPTPFIIGVPASFLMYKKNFMLPDDVWLIDLDSNKIISPRNAEELPPLPEPEGSVLKNHLKQVLEVSHTWFQNFVEQQRIALASMSMTPQPIKNLEVIAQNPDMWKRRESFSSSTGFNPLIYGNDVDSVDVATRVAMVRFFNSPNILANFTEHTRTLRLYPRPVVAFQMGSFVKSRPVKTGFTTKLSRTQAVEYFAEWALCPTNVVFLRVQTGVFDPLLIGDKPKWYSQVLQKIDFAVYDESASTLGAAVATCLESHLSDDNPTDESGSDSDGADSTSSSYSSLSDFVIDIQNSDINGETPEVYAEDQILTVDESRVFSPPSKLQVPDDSVNVSNSDSALSAADDDSDDDDSEDSEHGPQYADSPKKPGKETTPRPGETPKQRPSVQRQSAIGKQRVPPPIVEHARSDTSLDPHRSHDNPTSPAQAANQKTDDVFRYDSGNLTPTRREDTTVFRYSSGRVTPTRGSSGREGDGLARYDSVHGTADTAGHFKYDDASIASRTTPELPRKKPQHSASVRSNDSAYESLVDRQSLSGRRTPDATTAATSGAATAARAAMARSRTTSAGSPKASSSTTPPLTPRPPPSGPPNPGPAATTTATTTATHSTSATATHLDDTDPDKTGNLISTVTDEINGLAQTASHTISELFGGVKLAPVSQTLEGMSYLSDIVSRETGSGKTSPAGSTTASVKSAKPFAPLGNRKALVEKSGLVKHASQKKKEMTKQPSVDSRANSHSDNQQFLKDMITSVLDGQGVGWLKLSRIRKLMEDENYRNFVVSRLNTTLDKKLNDDDRHLDDICVTKQVFKGLVTMCKALISGLEHTYQNQGVGGMASSLMVLEILHTHYWEKEGSGSHRSESSKPSSLTSSPFGSRESLSSLATDSKAETRSLHEEHMVAALGHSQPWQVDPSLTPGYGMYATSSSSTGTTDTGSPVVVNGDEYENIELRRADDTAKDVDSNCNLRSVTTLHGDAINSDAERQRDSSGYGSESGDMLRDLVKNKELLHNKQARSKKHSLAKLSSADSDISEGSTLMSLARKKRSGSILSVKSHLSTGYRYHDGKILSLANLPSPDGSRTYLFELFIGKERSWLWDQMQFWEDSFLDAIAQERDIIGMDQGPGEMMGRYSSLGDAERKRLEYDEDRLLAVMLYNMVSFMVMQRVSKNELRRKVRRLLGKCHIGLVCSQEINNLLDQINNLHGNDIDLKPAGSRLMQKQSFTVHWGPDNTGDMLFMEVCDDCLILRSVTGAICDRWWYEKLVNMTYCPKTKVLCLWRRHDGKTQLNKFYTKKCKELYFCVKDAMEKAASRTNGKIPGQDLGGEFPVQDLKSGQGGLLQVCMEGIGLLFQNSKSNSFFIELSRVKKCFTQKGGVFVLEEFDPKTKKVTQRRYQSQMANYIVLAFHRIITIHLANIKSPIPELKKPNGSLPMVREVMEPAHPFL